MNYAADGHHVIRTHFLHRSLAAWGEWIDRCFAKCWHIVCFEGTTDVSACILCVCDAMWIWSVNPQNVMSENRRRHTSHMCVIEINFDTGFLEIPYISRMNFCFRCRSDPLTTTFIRSIRNRNGKNHLKHAHTNGPGFGADVHRPWYVQQNLNSLKNLVYDEWYHVVIHHLVSWSEKKNTPFA